MTPPRPTLRRTRSHRLLCVPVVAGLLGASLPATAATAEPTDAPRTATAAVAAVATARPGVPAWAGSPITASTVAGSTVTGAARAYRLRYLSTGVDGQPTVVSGLVYTPKGKRPNAGWPVVGWAHGTTGIADACAPSLTKNAAGYAPYLSPWLAKGYAVVATDYEGLGTPGRHPYLIGDSEGRSVIDMVRAARRYDRSISTRWFALGHSQGGQAALFAGKLAKTYGAGLNYRGTVAIAPPTQWKRTLMAPEAFAPKAPANPFLLLILSGLHSVRPTAFPYDALLTPAGRTILDQAETSACGETFAAVRGKTFDEVYAVDAAEQTRLREATAELAEPPVAGYRRPVLLVQGGKDDVVVPAATKLTAEQMRAAKTDATLASYAGAGHEDVLAASLPTVMRWAAARMR